MKSIERYTRMDNHTVPLPQREIKELKGKIFDQTLFYRLCLNLRKGGAAPPVFWKVTLEMKACYKGSGGVENRPESETGAVGA